MPTDKITNIFINMMYLPLVSLLTYLHLYTTNFLIYLNIEIEPITILAILLSIDYVTGIVKVWVIKGQLRSYRAIAGLVTKAMILILVLVLALMAKGINLNLNLYLTIFISTLIISETYSIFGNVASAIQKEEVAEFDAVSMVIKKVRNQIEKLFTFNRKDL